MSAQFCIKAIISILLLSLFLSLIPSAFATTETRYMRGDQQTVNGLTAYQLGIAQSTAGLNVPMDGASASLDGTKRPNDRSVTGFPYVYPPGLHHWEAVDDVSPDDYGSSVYTGESTSYVYDSYLKPAYTLPAGKKIAFVRIVARVLTTYAIRTPQQADIAIGIRLNTAYYLSSNIRTNGAWQTKTKDFLRNPATNQEWTEAAINDIQLAIRGRGYLYAGTYETADCTQIYMEIYTYTDATVYYSVDIVKRNSVGTETTLESKVAEFPSLISSLYNSPGLKNVSHLMPYYDLASTDSIVIKVYQKVGVGAWNLVRTWTTEQLGAESLDAAIWTVYYYLDISVSLTMVSTVYRHGTTTYNSRITNFQWTEAVVGEWYDIVSWIFTLNIRQWLIMTSWVLTLTARLWQIISSWLFNVITRAWYDLTSWILNLAVSSWHSIVIWSFILIVRIWQSVTRWIINLTTLGWYNITSWNIHLLIKAWRNIVIWIFSFAILGWKNITAWSLTLIALGWHILVQWIFNLSKRSFAMILVLLIVFLTCLFAILVKQKTHKKEEEITIL